MGSKLELGLCVFEPRAEGIEEVTPWGMIEAAQTAEAMDLEYLALPDRVSRPTPRFDTLTLLAAIACHTKTIKMKTHIFVLPLRHPIELARRVLTVDHLLRGRFTFAVGLGGGKAPVYAKEYVDVGVPNEERGRRADEMLEALKLLWTQPKATFEGKYYRFKDVVMDPKPYQRPHPPIWIGGASQAALRRTIRFGDGWDASIEGFMTEFGSLEEPIQQLRADLVTAGRDRESVHVSMCIRANINDYADKAVREAEAFWTGQMGAVEGGASFEKKLEVGLYGPPGMIADKLLEWHALGVQSTVIHVHSFDMKEQLRRLERDVLPRLR